MNLALADAVDLAEALTSGGGWQAISAFEAAMAEGAAEGLGGAFSPGGAGSVLEQYRKRANA